MMKNLSSDQDGILSDLNKIERELDILLSNSQSGIGRGGSSDLVDFYSNPLAHLRTNPGGENQIDSFYEKRLTRQQIFEKAFAIEQLADEIGREVAHSERNMEVA